jgi:tetratricopeptide (TPR) repeat protein
MGGQTMEIENPASFEVALRNGVHLMLGAGFSTLAHDNEGRSLPTGNTLADELRKEFEVDLDGNLSLPQLYTVLSARDREAADAYLKHRFTVKSIDDRYLALQKLNLKMIFTTNIDDLVWKIFENSITHYLNDIIMRGPQYRDRAAIDYAPLHGSVLDDSRPYRFTSIEVATSFSADPTLWQTFRRKLADGPTLFWGYSLQDAAALESLKPSAGANASGSNWITLRPNESENPLVEYLRALRFQIIFADTDELLDYVDALPRETDADEVDAILHSVSQYLVPKPNCVPQRPIVEFYSGAAPAWSDVFRNDLPRLEQYRAAENAVNSGIDVVITGIPASGKTTLLMQLAAAGVGPGPTLMPRDLTKEGAQRLTRALSGTSATVVLDRFCDDIDAWNMLRSVENVRTIAADRDYNISTVTHFIDKSNLQFISLSEISVLDQGAIRKALPVSIRTPRLERPATVKNVVSVLDFNLANTTSKSLASRLQDAVCEFQIAEPAAAEMLVLVAYVHSCGTVLSMDMALGYWREECAGYNEVLELIERVGKLMSEYEGDLSEDSQDYYSARSVVVAEAVVSAASNSMLKTVLTRFHSNLTTARICRFDVFRRRGYSHRIVGRAFRKTEEGTAFYDFLLDKDNNPYLLQQKALLLGSRNQFDASFAAIDQALSMSRQQNWRIEATHAELLFDANIRFAAEQLNARRQVDKAMELLQRCYLSDRRRALHAFSYSRRALKFNELFGDEAAKAYLAQAEEWLLTVQRREPFMSATKWLIKDVQRALS